jgi:hypothetical protein
MEARPPALPRHQLARRDRVTNWHVVTGRNAYTNKLETPAAPDMLRCLFNIRIGDFGKQQWDIRIRDDDHKPLWLIRPGMGRSVDVVAIPIPMTGNEPVMNMYPINTLLSKSLKTAIGMDVFIPGLPIRERASGIPRLEAGQHCLRA